MKLLANENFPIASVRYLREKGFDIKAIGEDYFGVLDKEVINIAIQEKRTIITFDRDYGELIFKYNYQPENGVIYLRLFEYESDTPAKIIEELLSNPSFNPHRKLTVVDVHTIRQRIY